MLVSSIWQGQYTTVVYSVLQNYKREEEEEQATLAYHDLWLSNFPSVRTLLRLVAIISDREKIHLHFFC